MLFYNKKNKSHFRNADGALLFFDITKYESYKNVEKWINEVEKYTEEGIRIMLLGNKIDLVNIDENSRKVSETEAGIFCNEHNLLYNEISAKTGENVKNSFENLIESMKKKNCYLSLFY